uniref:TF-B3 domain-containing protein n=1 Tax=Arundo donax TaxID=35708 RepID=A0A0A8XMY6_ARUDO
MIGRDTSRRPQFISVLPQDSMEKMLIPAMFVQHYMPKEHLNNLMAVVLGPLGKVWRIELEMNRSDVFFTGRWPELLAFHGITKANALLLRYEGNMAFTVKVFEPDGCQRESRHKDIPMQQNTGKQQKAPSASIQKRKSKNDCPSSGGQKKPKASMTSLNKASLWRKTKHVIGPPAWIRKHVNTSTRENQLCLAISFCDATGLRGTCTITLKTSMNSTGSWLLHGRPYKNNSYLFVRGWRRFCQENSLKEGDICTFNVIKATLWHAVITRCEEKINQLCNVS